MRGTRVELACFYWGRHPKKQGIDWHSSGTTTSVIGALKRREHKLFPRRARSASVRALSKDPQVGEVSVLAHSMGNWVTLKALRQMAIRSDAA
jgi:esterase/lipase superfamily enzyme